jgi:tetratricopeptide (TPR) repeat protein
MNEALHAFLCHRGDALALARQAEGVDARLLEASLLLCSRDARDFAKAGWVFAKLHWMKKSSSESAHFAAIRRALEGDYAGACRVYDEILAQDPRDLLALAVAQVFGYLLGEPQALRTRSAKAFKAWPDHHAVLSMHAFALEECGEYGPAEELARRALELEPLDLRAHHAAAHVMEMQGRFGEGVRWMGERSAHWTGAGAAATHLWWHLALYHVELDRPEQALAIYDRRMQGAGLSELIDASALLWRLSLKELDVGRRFSALASRWSPYAEDAHCAFNDLHAMMAFAGAGRWDCARRLLAAQERRIAAPWGTNHDMTRLVGLPACHAIAAYGRGDFAAAEALLRALPPVAHRIGGSHAQRDVLQLTRYSAALKKPRNGPRARAASPLQLGYAA